MITITEEYLDECFEDGLPMLKAHMHEIGFGPYKVKFEPDLDLMRKLEEQGAFIISVMRKDGQVIGYTTLILSPDLHHKHLKVATCRLIYLDPEHRNKSLGKKLIKNMEKVAKEHGCEGLNIGVSVRKDFSKGLKWLGYSEIETWYGKEL